MNPIHGFVALLLSAPALSSPYLGQKPPGLTPEPFAPGLVTTEHFEYGGVFTPDMKAFYLIRNGGKYEKIRIMRLTASSKGTYYFDEVGTDGEGFGDSDIYISFRQQDGSWGSAINLGDKINTAAWEASASVTPDGKYLFFHRSMSPSNVDTFWVDAKVIESLRPKS